MAGGAVGCDACCRAWDAKEVPRCSGECGLDCREDYLSPGHHVKRHKVRGGGVSEALLFELHDVGVRVKLIESGIVYTNFFNATEFNNDRSPLE